MLKGHIKTSSDRTCWVEYKDGFAVELRYMPRPAMQAIRKRCTAKKWDPRTHQQVEEMQDEQLWHALASEILRDWSGLSPAVLRTMADMDVYPTADEPYSVDNAEALLSSCYDFDIWVQSTAMELSIFSAAERAAQGNAVPPAHGNSAGAAAVES